MRTADSGEGQVRAMKQAVESSGVEYGEIDLVNTHATSTLAGDEIEARAIKSLFGE